MNAIGRRTLTSLSSMLRGKLSEISSTLHASALSTTQAAGTHPLFSPSFLASSCLRLSRGFAVDSSAGSDDSFTHELRRGFSSRGLRDAKDEAASTSAAGTDAKPDEILRSSTVLRVVFPDGSHRMLPTAEVRVLAQREGMEIQIVNVRSVPPVAKLVVSKTEAQLLAEREEKRRIEKDRQRNIGTKEMHMRTKIDAHDVGIKTKKMREMLQKGNRVKLVVEYKSKDGPEFGITKAEAIAIEVSGALKEFSRAEKPQAQKGFPVVVLFHPLDEGGAARSA